MSRDWVGRCRIRPAALGRPPLGGPAFDPRGRKGNSDKDIAATGGRDFASAFEGGLLIAAGFVSVALVLALIDVVVDRRVRRSREHATAPAGEQHDRSGQAPSDSSGEHAPSATHGRSH